MKSPAHPAAAHAATLHKDDHRIRVEEQVMAGQHDTHLTKADDWMLNQQEDQLGTELRQ